MDVNSRDPSQNIIPFRIKGVEVARFDICGNLGIGTSAPSAKLDVAGNVKISGDLFVNGRALNSLTSGVVINMDSQPAPATALNRQKKQSIPLAAASTLSTSDIIAKMSGVSVGKTQTYGLGAAQMASYGNIVVAVGYGTNSIAYSLANPPTASSWVGIPNSASTFTTYGINIAYANGTWVAVGTGTNAIAYSTMTPPVASSWVGIPTGSSFNGVTNTFNSAGRDIAYGNGAWVVVGDAINSIAYSLANPPTAESWVGIPSSGSNFTSAGYSITFGNGTWVVTGQGTNVIAYSTRTPPTSDSWTVIALSSGNDAGIVNTSSNLNINVIYANGVWLAAGTGTNVMCYSVENPPIANSWMPITTGVLFGSWGRSVAYGNGTWVACGESGTLLAYSTSRIPHSSSWVSMKGPTPSSSGEAISHISFNASTNTWYFLGDIGNNCMFYSTATPPVPATWVGIQRSAGAFTTQAFGAIGITTSAFTAPINVARLDNKVTFPVNRMLAVGGGGGGIDVVARSSASPAPATTGTISYSDDDGATWAMVPGGATNAMFSSAADIASGTSFGVGGSRGANTVAWNGEKWVAGGNGRTNSLAFSDDGGMTWTGITGKSVFSVEARDVAWNGQMWVAVGRGINFSTAYSYDGMTWMGPVDASGVPVNVFSYDIAGPVAGSSDISGGGNHVIWTGKMWVATGTRTLIAGSSPAAYYTVAYSMDGKTWTGAADSGATSTGFDMYAYGAAWNGRNFIATGRGTVNTLAFSTDVTATSSSSWQGLGNTVFSVWGRGITWGARRWMATGRGTNTVAFSTNGRNWQGCGANVFKPLRRFMAMGDTGLYTDVVSGQRQRGVAFSYSDDGITWDAPVVNQGLEFSAPMGGADDATRSVIWTGQMLLTNVITDNGNNHQSLMYSTDGGASWSRVPGSSDTEANGGTGMTTVNNGCLSVTTNTARTRFIAGGGDAGSATRKVYFSNDGFNWNRSVNSPNSTRMAWVWASLWVGGSYNRWLIGGSDATTFANGRIMYSGDADAVSAWIDASPATYVDRIIGCFAANIDFSVILAGSSAPSSIIYRSVNGGATWTTIDINTALIGRIRSIAFSPSLGRWVAVGGSGAFNTIIYSTDATGTAWIAPPQGARGGATAIFKNNSQVTRVIWDAVGGRFIVGGWNGGDDYTSLTNIAGLDGTNNNPGYTMAYSADGINWTPVTVRSSDSSSGSMFGPFMTRCREIMALDVSGEYTPINTGYSVTWNSYANRFVATGNGTTPVVYSSDGGVTWTPANQQPQQQAIAVAGGASAAASTGTVSPITYTIDGKTWSQAIGAKEAFGASAIVRCVKYGQTSTAISPNGRIWVAGAESGSTSCLAFSQNGIRWTAIASGTTMIGNVRAIAYAPAEQMTGASSSNASVTAASGVGNGVWVAGGQTTNSLIFSYDGISWSEVPGSLSIFTICSACAFGNGIFVAGGQAGTADPTAILAYSVDGINWQPIRGTISRTSSNSNAAIVSITYGRDERGRGLWVAGASTGNGDSSITLLYSYNGIDWIGVVNSSSVGTTITGIAYGVSATTGQGLWVASVYRNVNSFIYSTTGRDGWTVISNTKTGLFDPSSTGATGIAYLNGVWYATGLSAGISTGRTLAYSYDGSGGWFGVYPSSNMYGTVISTFHLTSMYCVATTNDYSVPCAASPAAIVPVRSIGWTAGVGSAYLQHPTLLFGTDATAISADGGRSWGSSTVSLGGSAFRGGACNDAFWNGSIWVAVGYDAVSGAKVATSRDGVTWSQVSAGAIPITGALYSVMWNGSVWMVGGDGSPTNDANTASIAWSADLTIWNAVANTDTKLYLVKRISWNGMYWVAVGLGTVSTMMYSKDRNGLVWEDTYLSSSSTNKTASITSAVNDVVWGGGRWVAVGRGNDIVGGGGVSILYSADTPIVGGEPAEYAITGRRWTGVASSASLFPYGATSVCWNGKRFVATGPAYSSKSGTAGNIIAWSADGISWTAYSTTKTVAPGQRWVAVGSGSVATIATSADGRTWTDVSGSSLLFADISGASTAVVNTMGTGARAIGWNGSSLIVGGARSATTMTDTSRLTATATTGRTTIPVCAFIGSGNGVMGGGTTNVPDASFQSLTMRASSSVFITHLDVNMREASQPYANMWLNTYTDLSATQLFQVTPESQSFSSALKWNGWSWVANFGITTSNPVTGEQYGSIWYCTDPLARVGWSVASNYATPRILMGQGGYAGLEWNGAAWLACGYDPNNNNLIYTTDKYGAVGWTAVSGIVSSGSASFQPVCIASSSRFWVVGGSLGSTSAIYYTNDRTGATGWKAISTAGGLSVLPGIRITSVGYNGTSWICCGGGRIGTDTSGGLYSSGSISWRVDADDIGTGWAAATTAAGLSGGFPSVMSNCSAVAYNAGAASPIWVVVGDVSGNVANQIAYTTNINGSAEWKLPSGLLTIPTFTKLNGIAWTGYSWIASCGAGTSRIVSTSDINAALSWNNTTNSVYSPTMFTNAVAYANIPISLLTTGMVSSTGVGAGSGAMWRGGVGRAQGLLPGGGGETTSVVVRSSNGAEGTSWSQVYSRNFLIAVGGGVIRDASGVGGTNRMAYSYDGGLSWTTNNTAVLTTAAGSSVGSIRTVKYGNGIWVAGGDSAGSSVSGNNCLAWSRDGVNWVGAGGTQIFGSAGACYAVCCNDRGRWVAVGGAALTTAGTYTNVSGSIYTMAWSDDGMNWTPILGSRALFGIVCQGVSYGADASGVGMWTAIGRGGTTAGAGAGYTGCAYSYDGKTWYLSQTSASLFGTSVNVLTERYAPFSSGNWYSVSLSSTGQYQSVVIQGGGNIWISSDFGVTWTARTAPGNLNWYCISLSSTGQYQSAVVMIGNIWTSSDFGVTWTARTAPGSSNWISISLSSTGQYQSVVAQFGNIQTSSDYGVTWTLRETESTRAWTSISISSSGQYQSAVVNNNATTGYIYTSSNYGVSWTPRQNDAHRPWWCISLSSTGQYQSAVAGSSGTIWTSSDYGVTWTSRTAAGSNSWYSISVSSTGQYQSAVATSNTISTSSDYGVTWTSRNAPGSSGWQSISLSSTGQYQTAVVMGGLIRISSNFGETWSSGATDSRSLGITYGKDATGAGMWVATAGRRDRDVAVTAANTMAYSYDGKLWRGITASAGLSEQAWSVAYGKDGFGVGMWVAGGYDRSCGLKWSYDGVSWNATTGASGASVWTGMAAGRRALSVYWNGSMWLASTSDTRNGEPRGTGIAANNASGVPGYLLYSYNGKNWLPVLAPNAYASSVISSSAQPSVYSVLPNPAILDFGSFYDDQTQRGAMIANTTARTVGAVSNVPIENINTIVPYGKGSLTTGQVPFLLGGDSGLVDTILPVTSELAASTTSLSTSTDGGITWRAVPNSTRVMTKVNKILCDETTQQIVAVGTGNYSVATSTPATAANADGWVGVFGSRMTNTRTGLFEKYGTGATWFSGTKMWIAGGRAQSRRGSSLAVSVNGTVWQDAKIVSQMAAGASLGGRGGGLTSRTTTSLATQVVGMNSVDSPVTTVPNPDVLYTFSTFTFDTAGATGRTGPDLATVRTAYTNKGATWATTYLNMTTNGIQEWTVPATGSYTIRAAGASGAIAGTYCKGIDLSLNTTLTKGEVILILVGQQGVRASFFFNGGGGGGTFVIRGTQTPIIVAGGGGGAGDGGEFINSNATISTTGNKGGDGGFTNGNGGIDGQGGAAPSQGFGAGGGGLLGTGATAPGGAFGGSSFIVGGLGGGNSPFGGFGGGGASAASGGGGGGGGYSGGGGSSNLNLQQSGGGGGSFGITTLTNNGYNTGPGLVVITANFTIPASTFTVYPTYPLSTPGGVVPYTSLAMTSSVIPYTASATPLLTYTDSAAAFSTQVSSIATNSQYNRAVVGGSGVQFVAGGRSGIAYSNDGQNWTAAASGTTTTVFQTPTNIAAYSTAAGSGGFDASFGTVSLTQKMSPPTTYPSAAAWRNVSVSATGQYQTAVANGTFIYTSSDYGITWTERNTNVQTSYTGISVNSTGQYQTAAVYSGNIWISSDFGVSWTVRSPGGSTRYWPSVSLSSTGQYQTAVAYSGNIWTSSDYGITWTFRATVLNWQSVSISSTGQYQSAVIYNGKIWISSDYGVSWTSRDYTADWLSISISSTGQYQSAVVNAAAPQGNIWISSDYGITWRPRTQYSGYWFTISVSATGQYQTAVIANVTVNGYIYTSSDFGVTWAVRMSDANRTWNCISVSSTGQYQTAGVEGGFIYTSSNYGVTWVQRSTATRTNAFTRIKSSASGQYQLATSGPVGNANGQLYVSSNYGQTWIPRRGLATWLGGAVSATGAVMTAFSTPTAATASILRSTDYGNTFSDISTTLTGSAYWKSVAMTNSAAIQTAVAYGGSIYRSFDSGATWSAAGITIDGSTTANTTTPRNWQDVAVSAETGAIQLACVNGGYLYFSGNNRGTEWASSIFFDSSPQATNRAWQAVAVSANGQYGLACVNSTTASGYIYRSTNSCSSWVSSNIVIDGVGSQTTNRAWQDVGMSANGKYQVACGNMNIFYSKDYGATWFVLNGSQYWSSVALSANGGTISATTNDATGGVWTYTMPDDQYYRPPAIANSGGTINPSTIRAITYGNSGTGALTDGYWVAGADASANTLAYSSNGIDWTAVVGSKTGLFNSVNGVAYGADLSGTMLWVAVGTPFIGSVPASTAYSIAYSYNMTTWTGIRNLANFTGQGNHVAYGQDEYGTGMWVAVGQGSGALAFNIGSGGFGINNTTIFYSYDGANWSAATGTGVFSTSGTDVAWGVDASGVATWVATGVGFTDPLTGVFAAGGQVAHSVNGRVWTPIRAPAAITNPAPTPTTLSALTRGSAMVAPPSTTGFVTPTYNNIWRMLGRDIDGEAAGGNNSGFSVSMSADGTVVAIGAPYNDGTSVDTGDNRGHVRVYAWNNVTNAWIQRGGDIDGESQGDQSGWSVSLSADGNILAIGAANNDGAANDAGHVRVYRYNASKMSVPVGWEQLGGDIDGEAVDDRSGWRVCMSADGTVVAIGAPYNDGTSVDTGDNRGHVRVYKYNISKTAIPVNWEQLGGDIDGEAANDSSGYRVSLSADGTVVAIGAAVNDGTSGNTSDDRGQVRVYKYTPSKNIAVTNQNDASFGPIGWNRLGADIDGDEYLYENYGPITIPTLSTTNFPVLNSITNWEIDISFTVTGGTGTWRALIGSMYNSVDERGWGIWISTNNRIHYSHNNSNTKQEPTTITVNNNTPYILNVTKVGISVTLNLITISTQAVQTGSFTMSDPMGIGPVTIGGWINVTNENLPGTISYVKVSSYFDSRGASVSLSADGSTVAIGAWSNDGAGENTGHVRVYKYNSGKVNANSLGPVGWDRLGADIDGENAADQSGFSVSLSADGTVVAIGALYNDGTTDNNNDIRGHVRVYKYNANKTIAITDQSLPNFGPAGWDRIGVDIDGEAAGDESGYSVSLSADGTTLAIGAVKNDGNGADAGHVRVYKLDTFGAITYTSSNPAVAQIYGNSILLIQSGATGTTTITATQAASPPFTAAPVTVQGTLSVTGTVYILLYDNLVTTFTPFTTSALTVAYGRGGSQGTGVPLWMVGGSGGNVFAASSRPSAIDANAWYTISAIIAPSSAAPFAVCNSLGYSNGIWVAGNNTDATNVLARSADGGSTWTPVTLSSMSGILAGSASVGTNAFCNYSLAYADYSNDTNLRSWVAVQGTKNFMFEGGVGAVATVSSNIVAGTYGTQIITTTIPTTASLMVAPPGAVATTYGTIWNRLGTTDISGVDSGEYSGYSVSLSADGTTVAIGAWGNNGGRGVTRIYKLTGNVWSRLGTTDISGVDSGENSGYSVSLSADGTTVAIGAYNNNGGRGVTRIYKLTGNVWSRLGVTDISGVDAGERSGTSVSLSADGTTVAIGAWYNNGGIGVTRIYKLTGNVWSRLGTTDISGVDTDEYSGYSVSLSADGTTVAIGANGNNGYRGVTRIYKLTGNVWTRLGTTDISGVVTNEYSGYSVSLSADGTIVAIGARGNNGNTGVTRIYKLTGNVWSRLGTTDISGVVADENSGYSVSLSADGTTVAIGAYNSNNATGVTRIYKIDTFGNITYTSSNSSVADVCGNLLLIRGANGSSNIVATQGSTATTGVLTVTGTTYTLTNYGNRAWWVAGGAGTSAAGVSSAVIAYTADPNGAVGWTKSASTGIANLATINDVAFSPQTQRWLAVGVGGAGTSTQNILFSDASGMTWTSTAVTTPSTPVVTLNTCIWNQLDASASAAGRWIAGGTRNDTSVSIPTSATLYISTDIIGSASPWTPIAGTGAILSQVYSVSYNGRVWIAAGVPATDSGSTSTLMRTTDPTGASGWTGITATNVSATGFDTAARSITWNADQQMWIATGENTADDSVSSVIYSLDVSGGTGTWRAVRESNSSCFSGQGNGIAFSGKKWFAVGEGTNQIVATTDISANTVFGTGTAPTWSSVGNANTVLPGRGTDIAFTGRNLIATGVGSGAGNGAVISTDNAGTTWLPIAAPGPGFTDASGGGTSITFEPTFDGTGRLVATGKSAANSITVSSDGGTTWNTSATATATGVQFSSRVQTSATTQSLFTTGGNSVAYVGNDTLFGGGGNDVHWNGKRWIATGKNSGADAATVTTATATTATASTSIINNNTAPVAVSDDGITWQCVSSDQAPNITEGTFVATNSRVGATPLIDSRITIMDGGDTELSVDYTNGAIGMVPPLSGMGAGIAQVDIIAELPVTSVSASNTTGTVTTIGVGSNNSANSTNGVGVTPTPSFDNTAFTITTRPV